MSDYQDELQRQAYSDLTNRAKGGIVIYLLAWLFITLPLQVYAEQPEFFYLNTALILLVFALRLLHFIVHSRVGELPFEIGSRWLVWTALLGALHWGVIAAWVLTHPQYAELQYLVVLSVAVFGLAGTTALSISQQIRVLFPMFFMGPPIIALLMRGEASDLTLAAMGMVSIAYVIVTARTASRDYWEAIENRALAEQRARQMEHLSVTDQLTQLHNRSYFDQRFREEWKRGERQHSPLSLLMLDLDHFKAVNDTYGHLVGDSCLQKVAEVLRQRAYRESDLVARYGGEEFVVLLPDTDAGAAAIVAERLRAAVGDIVMHFDGEEIHISCSIGGASALPDLRGDREYLLQQADAALYRAKKLGRNQYQAGRSATLYSVPG